MLKTNLELFDKIANIFNKHGFKLYMVGGTSRDFLLGMQVLDFDFTTDATPAEMYNFLPNANYRFKEFGTVSLKIDGEHVEITTLREEGEYVDYRHPAYIKFVKDPRLDYVRRDFTINALYIDEKYTVLDFCSGLNDLKTKTLRVIGDPYLRFEEDPLRIIRAFRFIAKFNLNIDPLTDNAIKDLAPLIKKLNPDKIKAEMRKVGEKEQNTFKKLMNIYKI
ncbi:MAG: CCA-adding enzyme [Tenericutes bacterium ADurb.Bin024]|nr:MAG: CCA-adding enzyme [Tenericutes bacterium ADurb.Bin024]